MRRQIMRSISSQDTAHDHQRDAGACSTSHEQGAAADFVDPEEGWEGAEAVDDAVYTCCQKGCL